MKNNIIVIVIVGLLAIIGLQHCKLSHKEKEFIKADTITNIITEVKIDTFKEIIYKDRFISERIVDTIYYKVTDTLVIKLPITSKEYKGDHYKAFVSGYKPKLDSIEIYNIDSIQFIQNDIIVRRKPHKWGLGIHIGYGIHTEDKNIKLTPYIGVGLSYNLITF